MSRFVDIDNLPDNLSVDLKQRQADKWVDVPFNVPSALIKPLLSPYAATNVQPLVHAHWKQDDRYVAIRTCFNCGTDTYSAVYETPIRDAYGNIFEHICDTMYFCPHCGAKMDEKGDENNGKTN